MASKFQDTFFFLLNLTRLSLRYLWSVGSGLSTPLMICVWQTKFTQHCWMLLNSRNHWSAKCSPSNASRRWRNVTSWLQVPDTTMRASWNITRDDSARLVWSNRDFFCILQIYLQYLLSYIFKFLICIYTRGILGCLLGFWPRLRGQKKIRSYKEKQIGKKILCNCLN